MPLTYPFRLTVLRALTDHLKGITVGNGYVHDLDEAVFRGRTTFGEKDPIPMLSILENPIAQDRENAPRDSASDRGAWDLMIQGFTDDDLQNPTDPAYILMADTEKRLALLKDGRDSATGILGLGKKAPMVDSIIMSAGVVRPPDEISAKAYFWLPFTLMLVEDRADPYKETA